MKPTRPSVDRPAFADVPASPLRRLAWFAAIWLASVAALGVVAGLLRWVLNA